MILVKDFIDDINNIIFLINSTYNIEVAIFDTECNLTTSTKSYLQNKGNAVHAPSLMEVMSAGSILVNNPGKMSSCNGCRFKDNCPSTIELLNCLKISDKIIGVIAFTSFTKDGHDKIVENIDKFKYVIDSFSKLISTLIYYKSKSEKLDTYKSAARSALELVDDGIIIANSDGGIKIINNYALELFSSCNLHTKSLYQLFDKNILPSLFSERAILNMSSKINNTKIKISSLPIIANNKSVGTAIKISTKQSSSSFVPKAIKDDKIAFSLDKIKGNSNKMQLIKEKIIKIQNSPSTVLITGETGTGKGLLAKSIHFESYRASKPFISVNCTSIPENLFESELFGYESGAFTGAKKEGKPGKFELANEGTLFLDEIGEMPLNLQSKLLNVLQDSTFERVGGIVPINVDVRIIAATNKDIHKLIEEKKFRLDLFYRLNIIPIELPALRERKEDILGIATEFLSIYNKLLNKKITSFNDEVLELFTTYDWPGNIRQLENVIEYCVNMAENQIITLNDLPDEILSFKTEIISSKNIVKANEYNLIIETINKYGWDVKGKTLAANELGIGLRTLYRKLTDN